MLLIFNGSGGPWYAQETKIRKKLVPQLKDLNIVVGGIVTDSVNYSTLINKKGKTDIAIPDKYYQVFIYFDKDNNKHITAAFLFPNVRERHELPYDVLMIISYQLIPLSYSAV